MSNTISTTHRSQVEHCVDCGKRLDPNAVDRHIRPALYDEDGAVWCGTCLYRAEHHSYEPAGSN